MALVAYDDSSDSEYDEDSITNSTLNGVVSLPKSVSARNPDTNKAESLFSSLPRPQVRENEIIEEVDDEFLHKKEAVLEKPKKRIKIDVPALNYYSSDDEDDRPAEKKKSKMAVSGLFTLLPPPKGTPLSNTSFVPNIVQKRLNKKPSSLKAIQKKKIQSELNSAESSVVLNKGTDSTDDEDIETPEMFDDATWQQVCGRKKKPPKPEQQDPSDFIELEKSGIEAAPDVEQPYKGLDNKAFKELLGNTKRIPKKITLIDIHEDDVRPDKELWLKSLTDPNLEAEPIVENPVDGTRKVKNHITALAEKALANDKELQMRWSENRFNRKQTQAKYGF